MLTSTFVRSIQSLALFAAVCEITIPAAAQIAETGGWPLLEMQEIVSYASIGITDVVAAPGVANKIYLTDQRGKVTVWSNGTPRSEPFADLMLNPSGEEGLLGMAFAPGYPSNPRVYFCYTSGLNTIVGRYQVDTLLDRVVLNSQKTILTFPRQNSSHLGGQIRFGVDGFLYLSVGDDGVPGSISANAQDLGRLHGKILRIDPEGAPAGQAYLIPPGNPLVGQPGKAPEILAWGLRNPWRFTFHPTSGALYIADVGEDRREEINVLPTHQFGQGLNFGWPYKEGTLDVPGFTNPGETLTPPYFEYATETAVIGGEFMNPPGPAGDPIYIFGDYAGTIRALGPDDNGDTVVRVIGQCRSLSAIGKDAAGNLYLGGHYAALKKVVIATMVMPPVFETPGGTYIGPINPAISSGQPQASIRYTLDGSDPTSLSSLLPASGRFVLSEPGTVKARAFYAGFAPSGTVAAIYNLQVNEIYAPYGYLSDYTQIPLTCLTPAVTIRYTIDGSAVTESSPIYDSANPPSGLFITQPTMVRARGYRAGWLPGLQSSRYYEMFASRPEIKHLPFREPLRMFSPVVLTCPTSYATIRYTTDGSTPNDSSPVYSGPIYLMPGMVLNATASKAGMRDGYAASLGNSGIALSTGVGYAITPFSGGYFEGSSGPTASSTLKSPLHVARKTDGTLFVAGDTYSPALWKIAGGTTTRIYQGVHADRFSELHVASSGNLIALCSGQVWDFPSPLHTTRLPNIELGLSPVTLYPEADGSFLAANSNMPFSSNVTINRCRPGTTPVLLASLAEPVLSIGKTPDARIHFTTQSRILQISGNTTTTAYGSGATRSTDGAANVATFYKPRSLTYDRIGNLYLVDDEFYGARVRKISPEGNVTTLHGPVIGIDGVLRLFAPRVLNARGSIAVDNDGILYGANGNFVWRFVQDDWDNDGIPDAMEASMGPPWIVGRDDSKHSTVPGGPSHVANFVFAGTSAPVATARLLRLSGGTAIITAKVTAGMSCVFEFSADAKKWYPLGPAILATGSDVSLKVDFPEGAPTRLFRCGMIAP